MVPNTALQLTNTDAAHSALRSPCLLSVLAAECHVRAARREEGDLWLCENLGSMYPRCDCTRNAFLGDFGSLRRRRRVRGRSALPQCLSVLRTAAASRRMNLERSSTMPLGTSNSRGFEAPEPGALSRRASRSSSSRRFWAADTGVLFHKALGTSNSRSFEVPEPGALSHSAFRSSSTRRSRAPKPGALFHKASRCFEQLRLQGRSLRVRPNAGARCGKSARRILSGARGENPVPTSNDRPVLRGS